jgi:hypothetical protein
MTTLGIAGDVEWRVTGPVGIEGLRNDLKAATDAGWTVLSPHVHGQHNFTVIAYRAKKPQA